MDRHKRTKLTCRHIRILFIIAIYVSVHELCLRVAAAQLSSSDDQFLVTPLTSSSVCPSPRSVSVNSATDVVYAACSLGGSWDVSDNPVTGVVYAALSTVVSISNSTITTIATASACPSPFSVSIDSETGAVYAACYSGGIISIDSHNPTITTLASSLACPNPYDIAVNSVTGVVYAACNSGGIISISNSTITTLASSSACPGPFSVSLDTVTGVVYAACSLGGVISISNSIITTLAPSSACTNPYGVSVNSLTGMVYAACYSGGVISISNSTLTTLASSSACPNPYGVSVNSVTGVVYAACHFGSVISIEPYGKALFQTFELAPLNPVHSGDRIIFSTSIFPSNTTGTVQWMANGEVLAFCGLTRFHDGVSRCAFTSTDVGNFSVVAVFTGDSFFKYGQVSTASILLVGYCFSAPALREGEDQTLGSTPCSSHLYPTSSSGSCSVGCVPNYPGATAFYTCVNGDWIGGPQCRNSFIANVSLLPSLPASTRSGSLIFFPMFKPLYGDVTLSISCTGAGTVIGSPLMFRNNSLDPQIWSFITPETSIISPIICSFAVGGSSASLYSNPPSQSVAVITYCNVCLPGRQNSTDATGLPICVDCLPGTASILGTSCFPCGPGSATNSSGQAYCSPCLSGTFQTQSGAKACEPCPIGTVATGVGATVCYTCAPGSAPTSDASSCVPCPPGTYSNGSQVSCSPCPIGRYASGVSSVSCIECPTGQVSLKSGLSYCTACPPGRSNQTNPLTQLSTCVDCPAGSASPGNAPCEFCQPGRFADSPSSFTCTPCSPGSASNEFSLPNSCPLCKAGTYQSGAGSTSCFQCAPDYFSNVNGSVSCQSCSSQTDPARTQCITFHCPPNHVYDSRASSCIPCSLGTAGVGVCGTCPSSFYTPKPGSSCTACSGVNGLVCSGGLASVAPGYWAYLVTSMDANGTQVQLYQTVSCPIGFCPGSQLQWPTNSTSTANGELISTQMCTFPRLDSPDNIMCGACVMDYLPWGNECVHCTTANGPLIFGIVVLSFGLVIFLLRSSGKSSASGGLAILLFFVQSASLQIGSVAKYLSWLQVFNLSSHSVSSCLAPLSPYVQTLLSILMPVILLVELAIVAGIHYSVSNWHVNGNAALRSDGEISVSNISHSEVIAVVPAGEVHPPSARPTSPLSVVLKQWSTQAASKLAVSFSVHRYIAGAMSVLLFCYTEVAVACFQYLYCIEVGSQRVVFTAPTMDCHSDEYRLYLIPVALALALFVAGFPILIFVILWDNKDTLFATNSLMANASSITRPTASSSLTHFMERWSPLCAMFHPRGWYWQPLLLVRRSAFVLASVLLVEQPSVRFMTFTFLNFGSLLLHQIVQPFDSTILNNLESGSYVLLVCISVLLTGYLPPYPGAVQAVLFVFVVPAAGGMVIYVIREQWRELTTLQRRKAEAKKEQMVQLTMSENPVVRAPNVASADDDVPAARRRKVSQMEIAVDDSNSAEHPNVDAANPRDSPLLDLDRMSSDSTVPL